MRIILGKSTDSHDAMQSTRWLITMAGAEFRHPQRQITIAFQALAEDLHMPGAVHWLQRQGAVVFRFRREHVLAEFLPVARCFP